MEARPGRAIPAPSPPARDAAPARRPPPLEQLVGVTVIPPALADGTEAQAREAALAELSRGDRAALLALAVAGTQPWLDPARPFSCGNHLITEGLYALTGGPELELTNIPGPFVRAAADLLNAVARFVVQHGATLSHGQVVALEQSRYTILILDTARLDNAAATDDAAAPDSAAPAPLRLVFLS